jgi:hypothetical protein
MTNHFRAFAIFIISLSLIFIFFPRQVNGDNSNEQKAIDAMYQMTKKYSDKLSAVFGETARTTDGIEFACHDYEISQYGQDFSSFGPPKALSTAITFSTQDEAYSGIYITIYILNSNKKAESFLKMMSDDWVPNTQFHNMPAIDLKTSEQVTNFLFICGRYVIREEAFNTPTIREELYSGANSAKLSSDNEFTPAPSVESGVESSDETTVENQAPTPAVETQPEPAADQKSAAETQTTKETEAQESAEQVPENAEPENSDTRTEAAPEETPETAAQPENVVPPAQPAAQPAQTKRIELPAATPYENWMNSWEIVSTVLKTKYVFDNISSSAAPPGGGYKMIVLKPENSKNPAVLEGRFRPKTYQSGLYLRIAGIRNHDASALVTIEVNGYPVLKDKVIKGADGWQDININIGALNPSFSVVQIKIYPDPSGKPGMDTVYIDDISVDGAPIFNKKLDITKDEVHEEGGAAPLLNLQGLWTDLRNFSYTVRQKGDGFTFSCAEKLNDYLWEVSGEGKIESETRVSISFTEKYAPLGQIVKSTATGVYDKSKKMISWTGNYKYFPGEWLFIK